jgi:TPP-dependent trihydroxycyclohexane-1,2-dione (THcHDO) dehydratase
MRGEGHGYGPADDGAGGTWGHVAVPETSDRAQVRDARAEYVKARAAQAMG